MNAKCDDLELECKVTGVLKESKSGKCEIITFTLPFFFHLEMTCIVTVPNAPEPGEDGEIPSQKEETAPVYIKIRPMRKPKYPVINK
jgi:hypothetical protein